MHTRLIAYDHATTISEVATWANELVGKEVPGDPTSIVVRVIRFQILSRQPGYDAMLLAEVNQQPPDDQILLREADLEVIEELTASIDEPV